MFNMFNMFMILYPLFLTGCISSDLVHGCYRTAEGRRWPRQGQVLPRNRFLRTRGEDVTCCPIVESTEDFETVGWVP